MRVLILLGCGMVIAPVLFCLLCLPARAQGSGPLSMLASMQNPGDGGMHPGGPPGADRSGDMPGRGMPPDNHGGPPPPGGPGQGGLGQGGPVSSMRGGLQLGPPGRWWDDPHFARDLRLKPEQQKSMDAIFDANREKLVTSFHALRQEESKMELLTRVRAPDEAALFAQIDRVAQARADLEKTNTHFLLLIRREMDPDQIGRLEQHR